MNLSLKNKYIRARNLKNFSIQFLYELYLEQANIKIDFNTFQQAFQLYNIDTNEMTSILDSYFSVNTLFSPEGRFIKIVE